MAGDADDGVGAHDLLRFFISGVLLPDVNAVAASLSG